MNSTDKIIRLGRHFKLIFALLILAMIAGVITGCGSTHKKAASSYGTEPIRLEFPKTKTYVFYRDELNSYLRSEITLLARKIPDQKVRKAFFDNHMQSIYELPETREVSFSTNKTLTASELQRAVKTMVVKFGDSVVEQRIFHQNVKASLKRYASVTEEDGSFSIQIDYETVWKSKFAPDVLDVTVITSKTLLQRLPESTADKPVFDVRQLAITGDREATYSGKKIGETSFNRTAFSMGLKKLPDIYAGNKTGKPKHPDKKYIDNVVLVGARLQANDLAHQIVEKQKRDKLERAQQFRQSLDRGSLSHCGIVIEVKRPIAQIQTSEGEYWLRIDQLYVPGDAPCNFTNGTYVDYRP